MKTRKGAALIWMLIVFSVLMILMSSVFMLFRQDLLETRMQEQRLQTYYVALSGIDLTYSALMDPLNNPKVITNVITKLKASGALPIKDDIEVNVDGKKIGTASVTIDRIAKDEINWIRITSVGKLEGNTTEVSSVMRINEANTNQVIREKVSY